MEVACLNVSVSVSVSVVARQGKGEAFNNFTCTKHRLMERNADTSEDIGLAIDWRKRVPITCISHHRGLAKSLNHSLPAPVKCVERREEGGKEVRYGVHHMDTLKRCTHTIYIQKFAGESVTTLFSSTAIPPSFSSSTSESKKVNARKTKRSRYGIVENSGQVIETIRSEECKEEVLALLSSSIFSRWPAKSGLT